MRKPDVKFFVPGFSKCGTTTLCSLLGDHPEIFIPKIKEPNFFAHAWRRGWDWYTDLFSEANGRLCGEGSTFYTAKSSEDFVVEQMLEHYRDAKLIFIARDPITRIESSYREHHHSGYKYGVHVPHDLEQTLREFTNIIDDTSYWSRLSAYRNVFDDSQIHIMFFEDMLDNQDRELRKCFEFLGVAADVEIKDTSRQLNPGSRKRYDTSMMRWIRTNRIASRTWNLIPEKKRIILESQDMLRRPFTKDIEWSSSAREFVAERLKSEAQQLLRFAGKSLEFWAFAAGDESEAPTKTSLSSASSRVAA
jgi:hypothetical protein